MMQLTKPILDQKDALNFLNRLQKLDPESKYGKKASETLLAINNQLKGVPMK